MLFISAQALPAGIVEGEQKLLENPLDLKGVSVKFNDCLGMRPLWAVPVTNFKDTMASMLLVAPNYPQVLYVIDTDDYVAIDKIQHYQNIKSGDFDRSGEFPILTGDFDVNTAEFCIDRDKIDESNILSMSSILSALYVPHNTRLSPDHFFWPLKGVKYEMVDEFKRVCALIKPINEKAIEDQNRQAGLHNVEARTASNVAWHVYRFTLLPVIVDMFVAYASDKSRIMLSSSGFYSCVHNHLDLINVINDMGVFSREDTPCTTERFMGIFDRCRNLLVDDKNVREALMLGDIGRNDSCPCGSGTKYKKCHGKKF